MSLLDGDKKFLCDMLGPHRGEVIGYTGENITITESTAEVLFRLYHKNRGVRITLSKGQKIYTMKIETTTEDGTPLVYTGETQPWYKRGDKRAMNKSLCVELFRREEGEQGERHCSSGYVYLFEFNPDKNVTLEAVMCGMGLGFTPACNLLAHSEPAVNAA